MIGSVCTIIPTNDANKEERAHVLCIPYCEGTLRISLPGLSKRKKIQYNQLLGAIIYS